MDAPLRHFQFAPFQFLPKAIDRLCFPEYKGAPLRGCFGYAIKKVVRALRTQNARNACWKRNTSTLTFLRTPPPADTTIFYGHGLKPTMDDENIKIEI